MKTWIARLGVVALAGVALALVGCTSPAVRIEKNPEAYERLSAEQQAMVREGKVGIGFSREAVKLALGDPDRVWKRTDKNGESEAWSYTAYETFDGRPLYRGYWHRYYGASYGVRYPYYMGFEGRKDREVFKVVFEGDEVASIESQT